MEYISLIITSIIGSGLIATLLNRYWSQKDKKESYATKEELDGVKELSVALLGWQIRMGCTHALQKGSISFEEFKQLMDMNEKYKKYGGNGFVKALLEKVEELPTGE